jgi:hypothetical protein
VKILLIPKVLQSLSKPFLAPKEITMRTTSLSTVTTDLIESYGNTAKNVVNAYRVGNERAVGFMDQRWESAVLKTGARLTAEVRGNALSAQKKLSGYYAKGIALTSNSADTAISKAVELAAKGVQQVAANAARFEKSTGVTTLNKLAVAVVPAAQGLSKVAGKIEQQSGQLVNTVAGKKAVVKATAKRVTAFKKARARKAA